MQLNEKFKILNFVILEAFYTLKYLEFQIIECPYSDFDTSQQNGVRFSSPIFKLERKYSTGLRNLWILKIIEYQNYCFGEKLNEIKFFDLNYIKLNRIIFETQSIP